VTTVGEIDAEVSIAETLNEVIAEAEGNENNAPIVTDHHAESTKVATNENQSVETLEDPEDGVRKARVETVVAEMARGEFI